MTYQRRDSDRYNYPEAYLRARIVGMLGGRAAEEIVYGTKTTDAESDIERATNLARDMAAMRSAARRSGASGREPLVPMALGVDQSVQVDYPLKLTRGGCSARKTSSRVSPRNFERRDFVRNQIRRRHGKRCG